MNILGTAVFFVLLSVVDYGVGRENWDVWQSNRRVEIRNRTVYLHNPRDVCTEAGLHCTSCYSLSLCVATNSGLVEFYTEYCDSNQGEYCSASLKECSGRKSYCSQHARFECQDEGAFPDPFDCNQYYVCSASPYGGISAEKVVCPARTAFNAKTFQCDLSDDDDICRRYPVPECPETGLASGALSQNPNLYYVCKNGLPYLFKCVGGDDYVYNPSLYVCVRNDPQTTTTTTEVATTTTEAPEQCVPNEYHLVPHTCRSAYFCIDLPNPKRTLACGSAGHFNATTKACESGACATPDDWTTACPTPRPRPVPGTCSLYYDCTSETEFVRTCVGYFDREDGACSFGTCPYTDF